VRYPEPPLDPPEEPSFNAYHSGCEHYEPCPCNCGWGWCPKWEEHVEGSETVKVPDECDEFEPTASYDPGWEEAAWADAEFDRLRDMQLEDSLEDAT
jgi:hypothetical protein